MRPKASRIGGCSVKERARIPDRVVRGGARLVQAISALAGIDDHRADIDVRQDGVTVRLLTMADD